MAKEPRNKGQRHGDEHRTPIRRRSLGGEQIEGRQAVRELLAAGRRRVEQVWIEESVQRKGIVEEIVNLCVSKRVPLIAASRRKFEMATRSEGHQGVLARAAALREVDLDEMVEASEQPFLVVVDGITDPHNLGAVLRSAELAGATGVVLPQNRTSLITPTVAKAAAGAVEYLQFTLVPGIPMESIKFVNSDTAAVPHGAGTMGSRSLQTAGNAVLVASEQVLERAKTIAAHMLEASRDDIVTGGGALHVAGVPGKVVSWAELAAASRDATRLPEGMEAAPLRHEGDFDGGGSTFPFGSHVSVVEVDTETGKVTMLRHIAVDDCGRILNPLLVRGQQHGGIAQGAAQVLFEWMQYDEEGNPITSNLIDYLVPAASELCSFEASNTQTDSPRNPLGAKGVGESGTIGSTPAVQNAVIDAVSHLGVTHIDMPCSPERVWRAIQAASSAG